MKKQKKSLISYWKILKSSSLLAFLFFCPLESYAESITSTNGAKKATEEIGDWEARLEYARLLTNLKRYEEALAQLKILNQEKPDDPILRIEVVKILYYQKQYQKAFSIIEKIPIEKLDGKDLLLLGDLYLALEQYSRAERIYRDYLESNPEDLLAKFKLAELLSWQKQYKKSIAIYEELLREKPEDIQLRRKYALVLMWMGDDKRAAQELEKTLAPALPK